MRIIETHKKIGPVSVDMGISTTEFHASLGNRYRTGKKIGICWRAPRFQFGIYTNAEYGMNGPKMYPYKHQNIRIGS